MHLEVLLIGMLLGLGAAYTLISQAWNGDIEYAGVGAYFVATLIGIFLFPRTVGIYLTMVMFASPVAAIAAAINQHWSTAATALGVGLLSWLTAWVIGTVRPDAT